MAKLEDESGDEGREAWLDRAEHDLASMRAYLAELQRRWESVKSEFASLNTAEQKRSA